MSDISTDGITGNASLGQMINAAFSGQPVMPARATSVGKRGNRKLWQLSHDWHCMLVGTCLSIAELRRLSRRAGIDESDMSDYTLHAIVVGCCATRSRIAEEIQRYLDKRYAPVLKRFAQVGDSEEILRLWREVLSSGDDVAGALWAAWSHENLDSDTGKMIFGDIHMLSHQVGASVRAGLKRLNALEKDNARLQEEAETLRRRLQSMERESARQRADFEQQLADAEARAMLLHRRELELVEARAAVHDYPAVRDRAAVLTVRVERLEERNARDLRHAERLAAELGEARAALVNAEAALELVLGIAACPGVDAGCSARCPAEAALAGRSVLCIGGRANLVEGYRKLVEACGGCFLHHDGGQEESMHRLDSALANADAVVCQAGCVSHIAYYRLKSICKKLDKPCIFVKSPGIGSFARGLSMLAGSGDASALVGRLSS